VESPGVALRNKGIHAVRVLTVSGEVPLTRRYFWGKDQGGICPADQMLGIGQSHVSPGAREVICRMGIVEDFEGAAEDAKRIGNVPVCKERLRQIVEAEGAKVTQAEKDQRRKDQVIRRQKRVRAGLKNAKPLPSKAKGHEEKYREMKIGVFYDQDKTRRHCFATAKRWQGFANLLRIYAGQVDFAKAGEALTLTDGAKWILSVICMVLAYVKVTLLDFYHLSQHVHQAAKACLGETPAALAWVQERLTEIKHQGVRPVLEAIAELDGKVRSPAK